MSTQRISEIVRSMKKADLEACLKAVGAPRTGNKNQLVINLLHECGIGYQGQPLAVRDQHRQREVLRVVEDRYYQLGRSSAASVSSASRYSRGPGGGRVSSGAAALAAGSRRNIRCVCGNNADFGKMIQCEGPGCGVWQHMHCIGMSSNNDRKSKFLCEQCRMAWADPYRELQDVIVLARLRETGDRAPTVNGKTDAVVLADKSFKLSADQSRAFRESRGRVQLRVGCLLLGDTTQFRFHWPLHSQLRINKIPYRVYGRGSSSKLGVNGRDDTFSVGKYSREGSNSVILQAVDSRPFVLVVAKVRERSDEEVMALMAPKETLEASLARIVRAVNGGGGSDSDDDIVTLSTVISLKCPLTGMRTKRPARFTDVSGLNPFDLDAFFGMVKRTHKWQCPHTMKDSSLENLQVDSYLERVLELLGNAPVNEVEVDTEGRWRPAGTSGRFRDITEGPQEDDGLGSSTVKEEAAALGSSAGMQVEDDSEEEEDEHEELRRTAAELKQASGSGSAAPGSDVATASGAGAAPSGADSDVIVISDSDSDDAEPAPPPAKRPRGLQENARPSQPVAVRPVAQVAQPPHLGENQTGGGNSAGSFRIRIPIGGRRAQVSTQQSRLQGLSYPHQPAQYLQQRAAAAVAAAAAAAESSASIQTRNRDKASYGSAPLQLSPQQQQRRQQQMLLSAGSAPLGAFSSGMRMMGPGGPAAQILPGGSAMPMAAQAPMANTLDAILGMVPSMPAQQQQHRHQELHCSAGNGDAVPQEASMGRPISGAWTTGVAPGLMQFSGALQQDLNPALDFQDLLEEAGFSPAPQNAQQAGFDSSQTMDSSQFLLSSQNQQQLMQGNGGTGMQPNDENGVILLSSP